MTGFREFVMQEFKIRGIDFRPNYIPSAVPSTGIRRGGAAKMNPLAHVSPSRPHQATFRMGKSQIKSQIALKK